MIMVISVSLFLYDKFEEVDFKDSCGFLNSEFLENLSTIHVKEGGFLGWLKEV